MTAEQASVPRSVGIIGLGVIGGSIAKDLAALGVRVLAYDRDPESLARARADGMVHETVDESLRGMDGAELVIVAVPGADTGGVLAKLAHVDRVTVTDVASTKRGILDEAQRLNMEHRFVGAHPLAGDHRSGWTHARQGLFKGAITYLCPGPASSTAARARVRQLWLALGATTVELDAAEHDRLLAYSSHLPHVAAAALALVLAESNVRVTDLGPGGRDTTRIAGSSPDMWTTIALENRETLLPAVESLRVRLERFAAALRKGDEHSVRQAFADARAWTLES